MGSYLSTMRGGYFCKSAGEYKLFMLLPGHRSATDWRTILEEMLESYQQSNTLLVDRKQLQKMNITHKCEVSRIIGNM